MIFTTWLDLIGGLLVIFGIALAVGLWSVPGGVIVGGCLLLLFSWVIDRKGRR